MAQIGYSHPESYKEAQANQAINTGTTFCLLSTLLLLGTSIGVLTTSANTKNAAKNDFKDIEAEYNDALAIEKNALDSLTEAQDRIIDADCAVLNLQNFTREVEDWLAYSLTYPEENLLEDIFKLNVAADTTITEIQHEEKSEVYCRRRLRDRTNTNSASTQTTTPYPGQPPKDDGCYQEDYTVTTYLIKHQKNMLTNLNNEERSFEPTYTAAHMDCGYYSRSITNGGQYYVVSSTPRIEIDEHVFEETYQFSSYAYQKTKLDEKTPVNDKFYAPLTYDNAEAEHWYSDHLLNATTKGIGFFDERNETFYANEKIIHTERIPSLEKNVEIATYNRSQIEPSFFYYKEKFDDAKAEYKLNKDICLSLLFLLPTTLGFLTYCLCKPSSTDEKATHSRRV